ncbi:MAG: DUF3597 domain-containing protein [Candidatus Accumulibacter sp.]|jgi:hypothetical protein|nr:DUF3597 domain-containing protein [Accumulibacter sp.]
MGFFSKILDKLGIISSASAATPDAAPASAPAAAAAAVASKAIAVVDVVAQLEKKAAASAQKLNWKTSIVDLLKLLDLDSSLAARKELAADVGIKGDFSGTAEQNIALHKAVLAKLAENGGNIPAELLK